MNSGKDIYTSNVAGSEVAYKGKKKANLEMSYRSSQVYLHHLSACIYHTNQPQ